MHPPSPDESRTMLVDVRRAIPWTEAMLLRDLPAILAKFSRSDDASSLRHLVPVEAAGLGDPVRLEYTLVSHGASISIHARYRGGIFEMYHGTLSVATIDVTRSNLCANGRFTIPPSPEDERAPNPATLEDAAKQAMQAFLDLVWDALLEHQRTESEDAYRRSRQGGNRSELLREAPTARPKS